MDELAALVEQIPDVAKLASLTKEMSSIKLKVASSKPAPDSPELRAAVAYAKDMSSKFGATSAEAKVAWSEVEDIAAAGVVPPLDQECLVEAASDACRALEELNRVLALAQQQ
jgi:hypothetical protein